MKIINRIIIIIMTVLFFSNCSKLDKTQNGKISLQNSNEIVNTPAGPRLRSQVHLLGKGNHIRIEGNHILEVDTSLGKIINDFGLKDTSAINKGFSENSTTPVTSSPMSGRPSFINIPANYNGTGWLTEADWTNPYSISSFTTQWIVPTAPSAIFSGTQVIFFFNGLQETNGSDIIQPVLQYGYSAAGGGNYWSIANWYVTAGTVIVSSLVQVSPGTGLAGIVSLNGAPPQNNLYNYQSTFLGYPSTTISVDNVAAQPTAVEVLEVYGTNQASYFPIDVNLKMGSISAGVWYSNTTNTVATNWLTNSYTTSYANNVEQTVVASNSTTSSNGEVDFYFHPYSSLFNPSWNNCSDVFSWNSIAGATSYLITISSGPSGTGNTYTTTTPSISNFLTSLPNGIYYIDILANNGVETYYSLTKSANAAAVTGTNWNNTTSTLSWNAVAGATTYHILVISGPGAGGWYNTSSTSIPNFFNTLQVTAGHGTSQVTINAGSSCSPNVYSFTH